MTKGIARVWHAVSADKRQFRDTILYFIHWLTQYNIKMQTFVVFACFAAVILQEGGSKTSSSQGAAHELVRRIVTKRQADLNCINEKLSENNAAQCESVGDEGVELGQSTGSLLDQSTINAVYEEFCKPECGNAILEALDECGADDSYIDFLSGLCGTNSDGDSCYEFFVSAVGLQGVAVSCYTTYSQLGYCNCQSALETAVENDGCCLKVYEDYYSTVVKFDLKDLFDECDVNAPRSCNNSPISGSQTLALNVAVFIIALALAIIGHQ